MIQISFRSRCATRYYSCRYSKNSRSGNFLTFVHLCALVVVGSISLVVVDGVHFYIAVGLVLQRFIPRVVTMSPLFSVRVSFCFLTSIFSCLWLSTVEITQINQKIIVFLQRHKQTMIFTFGALKIRNSHVAVLVWCSCDCVYCSLQWLMFL